MTVSNFFVYRGDVVQVDTWVSGSGKNGMRRDWVISDSGTGEILTRASRYFSSHGNFGHSYMTYEH